MLNKVIIQGRLTADPEIKTANEKSYCKFTLAVQKQKKDDGADFIDCIAWNNTAEFASKYFHKGDLMLADGRLAVNNYTDKDGKKRISVSVVVNDINFCGNNSNNNNTKPVDVPDDEDLPF